MPGRRGGTEPAVDAGGALDGNVDMGSSAPRLPRATAVIPAFSDGSVVELLTRTAGARRMLHVGSS
jgi:hypothetical protein